MTISAKIIADSISEFGKRITTVVLKYPRFIHSEFMTHRVFSRNASSSRAIPVDKMIEETSEDIAKPTIWAKNQKGMSSGAPLDHDQQIIANHIWQETAEYVMKKCALLKEIGVHKSIANRMLEPFSHITTIVTSTEWENFFKLRISPAAQPEICELATQIKNLMDISKPKTIKALDWHIPFGDMYIKENISIQDMLKISVARCARVSYLNFEGKIDHEKDYVLHDQLASDGHWSPFEHCAKPLSDINQRSGNFFGWVQYRQLMEINNG
jgi:thymidylate synthase ThyX